MSPVRDAVDKEYRCECGKLLFKGNFYSGNVASKCKRCGRVTSFEGTGKPVHYALVITKKGRVQKVGPLHA